MSDPPTRSPPGDGAHEMDAPDPRTAPRVRWSELTETDPHANWVAGVERDGAPFTGIAFSLHANGALAAETPFLNGLMHGRCLAYHDDGRLACDHTMQHARFVGEYRAWWPNGALRTHRYVGRHPDYRERVWSAAGVLVEERDDLRRETRRWYADGTLALERVGDVSRSFASDGALLLTSVRGPDGRDAARFEDDAMERLALGEVEGPEGSWHVVLGFLRGLPVRDRGRGIALLRRLLAGPRTLDRVDAARIAADLGLTELVGDLAALVDDERLPKNEPTTHGGTRGYTRSIGHAAREALARLGRAPSGPSR